MSDRQTRKPLYVLLAVIAIDLIGFGVAIPVLPYLTKDQHPDGWVLGLLLASYAAMQFVFAPIWGRLSAFVSPFKPGGLAGMPNRRAAVARIISSVRVRSIVRT